MILPDRDDLADWLVRPLLPRPRWLSRFSGLWLALLVLVLAEVSWWRWQPWWPDGWLTFAILNGVRIFLIEPALFRARARQVR